MTMMCSKSIFLHNHQTELDWLISSFFYSIFNKEGDFSAVMKGSLRSIPVFGYAIQDIHMCLLDRNWENDRSHFDSFLTDYLASLKPISCLMCPEGTTFARSTYESSQRYAKKSGRPVLEVRCVIFIPIVACSPSSFVRFGLYVKTLA